MPVRRRRACRRSHPALAPYGAHRTKDGQVIFGLQNEREWVTFCAKVLGGPELADRSALLRQQSRGGEHRRGADRADRGFLRRQ